MYVLNSMACLFLLSVKNKDKKNVETMHKELATSLFETRTEGQSRGGREGRDD